MRHPRPVPFVAACLVLTACSPGPDYVRPAVETPAAFAEAGRWKPAAGDPAAVPAEWWRVFAEPVLDDLQAQVALGNQNLKLAEAQYRSAQAALASSRSAFFPTVSGALSSSRGVTPSTATGATSGGAARSAPVTTTDSLSASAAWEIDVWGRIRRSVEAAEAKLEAGSADLAAARMSAQALMAQLYFQLKTADAQMLLYRRTVAAYTRFLELTRNRLAAGVASPLDVAQAETQLGAAETQALELENQRAQTAHAIATLVGRPAAALSLPADPQLPAVPAGPRLVPSTLLENRPDIVAAERRVAAANAQIGVAASAYFPVLDLNAGAGFRGASFAGLLTAPNRFWSLGPALALGLIDGGARRAAVAQAEAGHDQAVAAYRQTVLTAFQEVEDNLSAVRLLESETDTQARAMAAATRAREIAENQYKAGVANALAVITAQAAELSARVNAISITGRRLQAMVQLQKNTAWQGAAGSP